MAIDADFAALFKQIYVDTGELQNLVAREALLWSLIAKDEGFVGEVKKVPLRLAPMGGRSAAFATAQTNSSIDSTNKAFLVTRDKDYQVVRLPTEDVMASESAEGAVVKLFTSEMDMGVVNLGRALSIDLYRSGSGSRGQVAVGGIAAANLTLANPNDVNSFEVGMKISAGPNDSSVGLLAGTNQIIAINRSTGVLTGSANWAAAIVGITDSYYLFAEGDASAKYKGLSAWCPASDPTPGDNFFGVDRSIDTVRAGGVRAGTLTGMALEEAVLRLCERQWTLGCQKASHIAMHSTVYTEFVKSIGSKVTYINDKVGDVGFKAVEVNHGGGTAMVLSEIDCPSTTMFALNLKRLKFESLRKAPMLLPYGGQTTLFQYNADGIEMRLGYFGQLIAYEPAAIARATYVL